MSAVLALAALTPSLSIRRVAHRASRIASPAPTPRPVAPRRSIVAVRAMSSGGGDFIAMINQKNAENAVMVYSKTYCPYCSEVKSLFQRLGVPAKVVELDELADGGSVQDALSQVCGRRTVPQVFIGGQHLGGCDDTVAAMNSGTLKGLLEAAGISAKL